MRDKQIAYDIADTIPKDRTVIEIGPGDGMLTKALLETDHKVIGVEIDLGIIDKLRRHIDNQRYFTLIAGDFMQIDWDQFISPDLEGDGVDESFVVAGNLPYHLTGPILFKLYRQVRSGNRPFIDQVVFMVQKEVGLRLTAKSHNRTYGGLTVLTQYHGTPEYLFTVPADQFYPKPRVDGAMISIKFRKPDQLPNVEYDSFKRIVKGCFSQRRKMMRNTLGKIEPMPNGWKDLDFDFTRRPEHLTFDEFVKLTQDIEALF